MAISSSARPRGALLRVGAALALVVIGLILSGCTIELALSTTVENDGSGTIGIRLAADKEIQDLIAQQGGGGDIFADFEQQMPEGWETESGSDPDGTRWVTASTSFADLDELQGLLAEGSGGPGEAFSGQQVTITQEKGFFSTKTMFEAQWDAGSALSSAGEDLPEGVDSSMLGSIFQIQNRLTLPGSIGDNNANEVDGNTLVWTPAMTGVTEMTAQSTSYNWGALIGIIVAAVVVALVVIVVLVLVLRRKRPAEPPTAFAGMPYAGAAQPPAWPQSGTEQPAPPVTTPPAPPPPFAPPPPPLFEQPPAPFEPPAAPPVEQPPAPPAAEPVSEGSGAPGESEPRTDT